MSHMFNGCSSLKELNLNNFNTNNVTNMSNIFYECLSLEIINLDNFYIYKVEDMNNMFEYCSEELKNKIRNQYKNISNKAF